MAASAGVTPFGFAFDRRNHLLVSVAGASTLSTHRFDNATPTAPSVVSPAVPNGQAASCGAAVTPNGRFVYFGNAGTSSLSQYAIDRRRNAPETVEALAPRGSMPFERPNAIAFSPCSRLPESPSNPWNWQ